MAYDDGYGRPQLQFQFPPFRGWIKKLVIWNGVIFLAVFLSGFFSVAFREGILRWFGLEPDMWGSPFPPVWQAVTYGFLHSPTDILHVFFNMLLLYFFGEMVQRAVGERRFITHYLIAIVIGAGVHLLLAAISARYAGPAIGASGGVMAMVVAAAAMTPHARVIFIVVPVPLWFLAAALVTFDVFAFLSELQSGVGNNIANSIHLGGAAYGFLAVKRRWIWSDPLAVIERKRAVRRMSREVDDEVRMDRIMTKISREGISSLTRSERSFMQRQSERRRQS